MASHKPLSRLKTDEDYAAQAAASKARKLKWLGMWLWTGILAMITSVIGLYRDSPKVGNIAFVIMTFSLLVFIINLIELQFQNLIDLHFRTHTIKDRDGDT